MGMLSENPGRFVSLATENTADEVLPQIVEVFFDQVIGKK